MYPVESVLGGNIFDDGDSSRVRADNDIICMRNSAFPSFNAQMSQGVCFSDAPGLLTTLSRITKL